MLLRLGWVRFSVSVGDFKRNLFYASKTAEEVWNGDFLNAWQRSKQRLVSSYFLKRYSRLKVVYSTLSSGNQGTAIVPAAEKYA
jgi:hypothetical protein